jgi:hypothetical protein
MKDAFHCKDKNTTRHPAKAAEEKGKENNSRDPKRDLTKCFFLFDQCRKKKQSIYPESYIEVGGSNSYIMCRDDRH